MVCFAELLSFWDLVPLLGLDDLLVVGSRLIIQAVVSVLELLGGHLVVIIGMCFLWRHAGGPTACV